MINKEKIKKELDTLDFHLEQYNDEIFINKEKGAKLRAKRKAIQQKIKKLNKQFKK